MSINRAALIYSVDTYIITRPSLDVSTAAAAGFISTSPQMGFLERAFH